ncbi:polysaccharide deacetylase family protein [candidate division KSB1 bacterium]|nr:polysaccharide deacetylase family protein [candidate division KSB1 bacterium]
MKHYVILTIDTEFSTHKDNFGVWCNMNGQPYGLTKILEICNEYGVKATFFVDVYQKERGIRLACDQILNQGHEVQLHTHPNWYFDRNRQNLSCYNYEEQLQIIALGKKRLVDWTGIVPVVHRAGDFGANLDTLQALQANEIFNDFSYYWKWPDCELSRQINLKNQVSHYKGILEVPVTCHYMPGPCCFVNYRLVCLNEPLFLLKHLFQGFKRIDMRTIVLTLHSFSFINCNERPIGKYKRRQIYWPLNQNVHKFHELLKLIKSDPDFECVTAGEFCKIANQNIELVQNPVKIPAIHPLLMLPWKWNKLLSRSSELIYQYIRAFS